MTDEVPTMTPLAKDVLHAPQQDLLAAASRASRWPTGWPDCARTCRFGPRPGRYRVSRTYLRAFPDLANDAESLLELISMERLLRREAGDDAPTGFYIQCFPDQREEIEQQFAFDLALDEQAAEDAPPNDDELDETSSPVWSGPSSPTKSTPPRLPDRYLPVQLLGRGSFGDVWLCRDMQLGPRRLAIKVLRQDAGGGAGAPARFRAKPPWWPR